MNHKTEGKQHPKGQTKLMVYNSQNIQFSNGLGSKQVCYECESETPSQCELAQFHNC